jgi:hypothetical protein
VATFGLVLQLLGVAIAFVALLLEYRSHSKVKAQTLSTRRDRPRVNPWRQDTRVRYQRPNPIELSAWKEWVRGRTLTALSTSQRSDPEVLALGEFLLKQQKTRDELLALDWDHQAKDDDDVRARLKFLFEEQSRLLVEQETRSARRVRVEGVGLLIAAVGTIISGVAG